MIIWRLWEKTNEEWDEELLNFSSYNVFQLSGWGEIKTKQGWRVIRIYLEKNDKCIAMVQIQYKKILFNFGLIWIPGGPVGDLKYFDKNFFTKIKSLLNIKFIFMRMNIMRHNNEQDLITLKNNKWKNSYKPILSGVTVLIETNLDQTNWLSKIKNKHRYYVKKALTEEVNWKFGQSSDLLNDLNFMVNQMNKKKGLNIPSIPVSLFEKNLKKNIRLLIGYVNEKPISGCLVLMHGNKSNYLTAANIDEGRNLNTGYAMIFHLRKNMIEEGIDYFDLGGINPNVESVKGVNHFKLGFGNKINYIGEFEICQPFIIRYIVNLLLKNKFS